MAAAGLQRFGRRRELYHQRHQCHRPVPEAVLPAAGAITDGRFSVKHKRIITGMLAAAIVALGAAGCASDKQAQAALRAQASISQEQAQQTALAHAPGGTIKEGELENDKGKLIWWF